MLNKSSILVFLMYCLDFSFTLALVLKLKGINNAEILNTDIF